MTPTNSNGAGPDAGIAGPVGKSRRRERRLAGRVSDFLQIKLHAVILGGLKHRAQAGMDRDFSLGFASIRLRRRRLLRIRRFARLLLIWREQFRWDRSRALRRGAGSVGFIWRWPGLVQGRLFLLVRRGSRAGNRSFSAPRDCLGLAFSDRLFERETLVLAFQFGNIGVFLKLTRQNATRALVNGSAAFRGIFIERRDGACDQRKINIHRRSPIQRTRPLRQAYGPKSRRATAPCSN